MSPSSPMVPPERRCQERGQDSGEETRADAAQGASAVRSMLEKDLDGVIEIEREAYEFPWARGIFRDCLRVGYKCFVAEEEGELLAYAIMSVAAREAHILNLCIRPRRQGCGLGKQLLHHLLERASRAGADTMFLEVRPSNRAALLLYRSAGFCEVGCRRGYYPAAAGREDALVLAKTLAP